MWLMDKILLASKEQFGVSGLIRQLRRINKRNGIFPIVEDVLTNV